MNWYFSSDDFMNGVFLICKESMVIWSCAFQSVVPWTESIIITGHIPDLLNENHFCWSPATHEKGLVMHVKCENYQLISLIW